MSSQKSRPSAVGRKLMEAVAQSVKELLPGGDGHGFDHVERVRVLSMMFAKQECADLEVVELAALLHDVDDYKLFGQKYAEELINANAILDRYDIGLETKVAVLDIVATMGYSKHLEGIRPSTLEGQIVSDADMCDAIGAMGVLRTHAYALSKGDEFFDKTLLPEKVTTSAEDYKKDKKSHSAQHFFDKLLLIPSILMTDSGREEGAKRKLIMTQFLRQLFEEGDSQDWLEYLDEFERATP